MILFVATDINQLMFFFGGLGPGGLDIWDPHIERECDLG